jgi:exopolysaccharide/PEP-CTERM locus tyrosine autokinase
MVDRDKLREAGFIVPNGPVTGISEEFRIVKRQLLLAARGNARHAPIPGAERILICSAHPDEGKTFCALNLALSIAAEKDNEVLLVDADFAKPSILSSLGLQGSKGLMDALTDPDVAVEDCIIHTDIEGLTILPAGEQTNNDTEFLASVRTEQVLNRLTQNNPNRIVIFDSPPALSASPASVLASHVGQVVMIVKADETTETALRDALSLMAGCEHIQLLLNGTKFSPTGRRFGSYYGYGE